MDSFNISIPTSLRDIKLGDWQKFVYVEQNNKEESDGDLLNMKALQIFCGMSISDIKKVPINSFDSVIEHLSELLSSDTPRVDRFKLKGTDGAVVEFGLIPNLDKMSYGEYQDLVSYIGDHQSLHKAMAVLYRPIVFRHGDRYKIHEYKGTEDMARIMKEMPVDIALGAKVFFYRLARKLQIYTMDSLAEGLMKEEVQPKKKPLEKNGVYMSQS